MTTTTPEITPLTEDEVTAALAEPEASADGTDPAAPWGRKADGTPKAKPGRRPSGTAKASAPSTPPKRPKGVSGPQKAAQRKTAAPDHAKSVRDLLLMPGTLLLALGGRRQDAALTADGAALVVAAPAIGEATAELAAEVPAVAAILDRLATATPYAGLITAAVGLGAQIAANHGMIPAGALGSVTTDEIITAAAQSLGLE